MLHVVHHPDYIGPPPAGSALSCDKYGLTIAALRARSAALLVHAPEPMPRRWIEMVHEPAYVDEVLSLAVPAAKERRIGFRVTAHVRRRSLLSVGGTYLAARLALDHGYAANVAGGSHHALYDTGAGYCVFNDLAIASRRLLAEGACQRIMIVDLDVHQGDGTALLTTDEPAIFTLSLHAERNFPARKQASSLDVPLPDGMGDDAYLAILTATLPGLLDRFAPDLILYQAGVDPHVDDRLGRLALSDAGLRARDQAVIAMARARGVALASTLGGGYAVDRDDARIEVANRHAATIVSLHEAMRGGGERPGLTDRQEQPPGLRPAAASLADQRGSDT